MRDGEFLPHRDHRQPTYTLDLFQSSPHGDHNRAALVATAAWIVNAVPAVVAVEPGVRTTLDLPPFSGKGLYAPH